MAKGFMDVYKKKYDTSNGYGSRRKWQEAFEQRMNLRVNTIEETESKRSIYAGMYDCRDADSLKKAYRKLMQQYHPDIAGDTVENTIIAQAINDVYFKLKGKFA